MPVSASILIISDHPEERLIRLLSDAGHKARPITQNRLSNEIAAALSDTPDVLFFCPNAREDLHLPPDLDRERPPLITIGGTTFIEQSHSLPRDFSDIELLERLASLLRLQTMKEEFTRRKNTLGQYGLKENALDLPDHHIGQAKILVIGDRADLLGDILLRLENKAQTHICRIAGTAPQQLRENYFDGVIILGVASGDSHLRLVNDLRADSKLFSLPVVFVLEHESNREAAYVHGASDAVVTPDEMDSLLPRLSLHIQLSRYRRTLQTLLRIATPLRVADGPSGLYSFGFMQAHLGRMIRDHKSRNRHLSVASLCLSNLDELNNAYGYPAGDQILRQTGSLLSTLLRGEDFCCRHSGGRFIIAMPNTTKQSARIALDRICSIARHTEFSVFGQDGPVLPVFTPGLAELKADDTLDNLLERSLSPLEAGRDAAE